MATPRASVTTLQRVPGGLAIGLDVAGANPVLKRWAPDIDLHAKLRITLVSRFLNVLVRLEGDRFPNAELFLTDVRSGAHAPHL